MPTPAKKTPAEKTQEVARQSALSEIVPEVMGGGSHFDESALRELSSFDAALEMAAQAHGGLESAAEELGDGFSLLDDKSVLIGRPMLLMEWAFRPGDFGTAYVSVRLVAKLPGGSLGRFIVNDGGTGIAEQLAKYTKTHGGRLGGLVVEKGFRRSDYEYEDESTGEKRPATTWYLDTGTAA